MDAIVGNTISLRPITQQDTADIVRWRNNPAVLQNFIDQQPITEQSHNAWLQSRVQTGQVYQFIIVENSTGRSVGSVFLRDISPVHKHCEYGVFIGEDTARGKGYGTQACRLACGFAFEQLLMQRVFLRVLAQNIGAVRSYEKAGFTQEGLFRKHVWVNGGFEDVIFMGLLQEEWQQ